MRRIMLHLGVHRTGMRGLQDRLFTHRATLARAGVLYPDLGLNHAHHALAAPWMTLPGLSEEHFGVEGPEAPWRRLRAELAAAPQATVLLSAEAFSRAGPQPVDMGALAARLRALGAVQVVLTVRAQAHLLPALWLELARHQVPPTPAPFIARALRDHVAAGVWLDFNRLYDHLLQGFAPDEITILDHDTITAAPGGALAALLDLAVPQHGQTLAAALDAGAELSTDAEPDPTGDAGHPLAVLAAARICAPAPPRAELASRIAAGLGPAAPGRFGSQLLTRAEQREMDGVFAPLNAAFQARVQRVQPDFTLVTPPPPDPATLWRDDMDADLWAKIAADLVRRARAVERLNDPPPPNLPKRIWRRILDICLG